MVKRTLTPFVSTMRSMKKPAAAALNGGCQLYFFALLAKSNVHELLRLSMIDGSAVLGNVVVVNFRSLNSKCHDKHGASGE